MPVSSSSQIQNLSGFMIAGSDPGQYGQLKMFVTPRDNPGVHVEVPVGLLDEAGGAADQRFQ